ncbi:putative uncharacterized protein ASB16-AS1 [Molothrus ater]|uniref:putative uncharacterized protein ASB16-AS1 n=1 Tax=Molothrus ater TaxID=84834 RepID=UPI001749C5B2|nr:putative uncharacterized protein ASB16-AS1 [Molothrus ater]
MPQTQEISSGADFALRTTVRRFQSAASPRSEPPSRPAGTGLSPSGGPGSASCQGPEAAAEAGAGAAGRTDGWTELCWDACGSRAAPREEGRERRNREGGKLEPLSQGTARVGEAEPAACEREEKQCRSRGKSGKDEGRRNDGREPRRPRSARPRPRRAAPEQRLVPAGPAPPRPPAPSSVTDRDGTSRAGRV